jgi:hypothetical protein
MGEGFLKTTAALLFVAGFTLCRADSMLATDFDVAHLRKESTDTRAVQSIPQRALQNSKNFTYRANYTSQFQYLRDTSCDGPAPVIQVACHGPNIQLLNTSDPSIVCSTPFVDENGWSTITCNNTCASDTACEGVYLNIGGNIQDVDRPYGEIRFQCEGGDLDSIAAYLTFLDSGKGVCNTNTQSLVTRNFHVARMGVSCPTESGNREYVFDDLFFECRLPALYNARAIPSDGNPGDVYTCTNGVNCMGAPCEVDFYEMVFQADVMKFMDKCVEGVMPVTPTPVPVLNPTQTQFFTFSPVVNPSQNPLFSFSAKFEAAWGLWFDPLSVVACSSNTPTVRLTCRNGTITFVNSTYETVNCITVSPDVMECTDNSTNYVDQFTGVVYVS